MVSKNEAFPSKYVKAADLPEPVVGTIKVAELEQIKGFDGKPQNKVVVYFARGLKPLPLNRVNWESVADICGSDDSDDFPGTKVELYATTTSMNGKTMDCVRIRKPGAEEKKRAVTKRPAQEEDLSLAEEMNDEIPPFA